MRFQRMKGRTPMRILRIASIATIGLLLIIGLSGLVLAQDEGTGTNNTNETTVNSSDSTTTTTTTSTTATTEEESTATPADSGARPRIAVHTFENPPNYYNSTIGNGLTSIVITHLAQSGRFDVIQRGENLGLIVEEIDLGQSGYIEPGTAVEMGHVLGVEYILSGRVTNFGYEETSTGGFLGAIGGFGGLDLSEEKAVVRVDFSLIDATTGMTVLAATAEGKESDQGFSIEGGDWGNWVGDISYDSDEFMDSMIGHATLKAVDSLMAQILELFPVQAPILAVTPDFVILEIGANAGIEEGMEFEVYRVTGVTNAAGEVVWEERALIGRVIVTQVELTSCKAEISSGSGFAEGDLCILDVQEEE
jgi:curli biogenesis system outer membrane secretion channel CsgG